MVTALKYFERAIAAFLAMLISLVILLATADLAVNLLHDIVRNPPRFLVPIDELLDILGQFLIILVGFELLETVKAYLRSDAVHAEVVLIVALIALARRVIVIEPSAGSALTLLAEAALMLAIAGSYKLVISLLRSRRTPKAAEP
ncbi:MAG TPA: phosphate-starvation-inducible PsiE family protein [Elusimicrobiota bacterium]|nr:phosphate-starvation-inducible PsiE family protein [Elusimicrobiota bacterium]